MKIMLDLSGAMISDREKKFDMPFWQLRTPLTGNALTGRRYGLDNGCFTEFREKTWRRMVEEARHTPPVFVSLPDVVGDARRTLELFEHFKDATVGVPRALVLQDGIGNFAVPWDDIAAVFVGGSDQFKIASECVNVCRAAQIMGKWIHVGRVNTIDRLNNWIGLADSIDGSGISRYDHMLSKVVDLIKGNHPQEALL